jgi:hypothetical protein
VFVRPVGGAPVDATRVCRSGGETVPCGGANVRSVAVWPLEPLTPGQLHRVQASPTGAPIRDRAGNAAAPTSADFTPATGFEEEELPAVQRWRDEGDRDALGGRVRLERLRGATFAAWFRGTSVTWFTLKGRAFGKAEVFVDGRSRGVVDLYATRRGPAVGRSISDLGGGGHTIEIRALGRARRAATDTFVAVDALRTRDGTIVNPNGGGWAPLGDPRASGGTYAIAELEGAEVRVRFAGTGIEWTSVTGRDGGYARVIVDGETLRTVDLFSSERTFGVTRRVDGLGPGVHTFRIVVTGQARRVSRGTTVAIDRFDVLM